MAAPLDRHASSEILSRGRQVERKRRQDRPVNRSQENPVGPGSPITSVGDSRVHEKWWIEESEMQTVEESRAKPRGL